MFEWLKQKQKAPAQPGQAQSAAEAAAEAAEAANRHMAEAAAGKERSGALSDGELLKTFAEYFAPNRDFYSVPGSEKFEAYFRAIREAQAELLRQPALFRRATGRDAEELRAMLCHPKPGVTSMLVCGLIFHTGCYAVIRDALLCVDFAEDIPHCIALYLLLTAQKLPADRRRQGIDAGEGTDVRPLTEAMNALQVCDPQWHFRIF